MYMYMRWGFLPDVTANICVCVSRFTCSFSWLKIQPYWPSSEATQWSTYPSTIGRSSLPRARKFRALVPRTTWFHQKKTCLTWWQLHGYTCYRSRATCHSSVGPRCCPLPPWPAQRQRWQLCSAVRLSAATCNLDVGQGKLLEFLKRLEKLEHTLTVNS